MLHRHAGKAEHQGVKCQDMGGGGTGSCHAWKTQEGLGAHCPRGCCSPWRWSMHFGGAQLGAATSTRCCLGALLLPQRDTSSLRALSSPGRAPPLHLNPSPQP